MLDELLHRVSHYTPRTLETDRRFPEAAVLVPITRSEEPEPVSYTHLTLPTKA